MSSQKVWFITGCSTGFGRTLAKEALLTGAKVAITARNIMSIKDFEKDFPENALLITLDVTDPKQVKAAVEETQKMFGRIDVLVNNAGYGLMGAIEEVPNDEIKKLFDTNFFGLLAVTRQVLPIMRQQKSGYIINISSIAGVAATAGMGFYNASKFAVEGLSEALALEVNPLGIKVTLVEPGPFRTDFAGRSLHKYNGIADYDNTRGVAQKTIEEYDGKQPGDPEKAAQAIISLIDHPYPPLHLPLGKMAVDRMRDKISSFSENISAWEKVALDADFKK